VIAAQNKKPALTKAPAGVEQKPALESAGWIQKIFSRPTICGPRGSLDDLFLYVRVGGGDRLQGVGSNASVEFRNARRLGDEALVSLLREFRLNLNRRLDAARAKLGPAIEAAHGVKLTHTDLLVALVARVLLKHPRLNASWSAEGILLHARVNMGVAIAVNDGVVAAVIPNAHTAGLAEIARQRRDVAERARAGRLHPADLADATFTISNLGMYHVDAFSAIITPPQAAILAVGAIADRVVAVDGKPAVRPMMTLTLSCDHRVADGARAAMFLNDLATAIHAPATLLASA